MSVSEHDPIPHLLEGSPRLAWHHVQPDDVAAYWLSDLRNGLSQEEASTRLFRVGRNRLPEEPPEPLWKQIYAQVSDFTVLALLAAAVIAFALGLFMAEPGHRLVDRFGDSGAILAIVIINAVIGLIQARRAERALLALREMTAPIAKVVRDGRRQEISSDEVVPGDLVLLDDGDRIPADLRLTEAHDLEVDEAALTGESMPVTKDPNATVAEHIPLSERCTMAFMGTRVARGRGRGIVGNTGVYTELGAIAGMLARVEPEETPLEKDLEQFGKKVVIGCLAVSLLVFGTGLLFGRSSIRELFLVAVALAVAAIPEGLPAVTTIVLALGTQRMARHHALVRRLPAVETLGSVQVICTDKTGTLTQNMMTARRIWVSGDYYRVVGDARRTKAEIVPEEGAANDEDLDLLFQIAAHASGAHVVAENDSFSIQGDATDAALLILSRRAERTAEGESIGEQPFTSARRMASVLVRKGDQTRAFVRGAPEALLARSTHQRRGGVVHPLDEETKGAILAEATNWSARSMRVIALGVRDDLPASFVDPTDEWESNLTFVGLVGIVDPPRSEVPEAVAAAQRAGVRTIMITGDHPATARAIAIEIGLWTEGDLLLTGHEIDSLDQQKLMERIDRVRVVARATAEHKLRIVEALKSRGFVCAMTGDGVNDAPAVKAASIGVAMGRAGTDVTKEAAALVLSDDNFATIVAAVDEGRTIYANIRKFIYFLLSSNAGAVLFVLCASLLAWESPLAPIQILWINLITNGLPALALGVDGRDPTNMLLPPREPGTPLLTWKSYLQVVLVGAVMAVTALYSFHHFMVNPRGAASPEELAHARAIVFSILAVGPLCHAFNCRSEKRSLFSVGVFSNLFLWIAVLIGLALQAIAVYAPPLRPLFKTAPLSQSDLLWVIGMSLVPFVFGELQKLVLRGK
jgi:Ca2+-transporting ATPase